jgi:hypothetical protein
VSSSRWNENWQGKPKYSEKTCPSATLSINPTWPDLGSNPGRRGGKPATCAYLSLVYEVKKDWVVSFTFRGDSSLHSRMVGPRADQDALANTNISARARNWIPVVQSASNNFT